MVEKIARGREKERKREINNLIKEILLKILKNGLKCNEIKKARYLLMLYCYIKTLIKLLLENKINDVLPDLFGRQL